MKLTYIGHASLMNVPARDLSETDVKQSGFTAAELIATGLYKAEQPAPEKKQPKRKDGE